MLFYPLKSNGTGNHWIKISFKSQVTNALKEKRKLTRIALENLIIKRANDNQNKEQEHYIELALQLLEYTAREILEKQNISAAKQHQHKIELFAKVNALLAVISRLPTGEKEQTLDKFSLFINSLEDNFLSDSIAIIFGLYFPEYTYCYNILDICNSLMERTGNSYFEEIFNHLISRITGMSGLQDPRESYLSGIYYLSRVNSRYQKLTEKQKFLFNKLNEILMIISWDSTHGVVINNTGLAKYKNSWQNDKNAMEEYNRTYDSLKTTGATSLARVLSVEEIAEIEANIIDGQQNDGTDYLDILAG
jgi:hypothetical protein